MYVRTFGRTDVRTVTTKIFEIDGLSNFLRYGAPLARLRRAGAPLKKKKPSRINFKNQTESNFIVLTSM